MTKTFFKRSFRLNKADDFKEVRMRGLKCRQGALALSFLPGEKQRLGIVVPRHVGEAVVRNRMRRVIREFFRTNRGIFPSGDSVFVLYSGVSKLANQQVRASVLALLQKINNRLGRG